MRDRGCGVEVTAAVGERVRGDVDDPDDAGVSRRKQRAGRRGSGKWAAHARAPADGDTCSPRRTATPGISPAGRSPVVLHPNASHGLPPPYVRSRSVATGWDPATSPKPAHRCQETMKDALSRRGATKPKRAADAPEGTETGLPRMRCRTPRWAPSARTWRNGAPGAGNAATGDHVAKARRPGGRGGFAPASWYCELVGVLATPGRRPCLPHRRPGRTCVPST